MCCSGETTLSPHNTLVHAAKGKLLVVVVCVAVGVAAGVAYEGHPRQAPAVRLRFRLPVQCSSRPSVVKDQISAVEQIGRQRRVV